MSFHKQHICASRSQIQNLADNMIRARNDGRDDVLGIFHGEEMESGSLPSHTLNDYVQNVTDKA